MRHQRETGASGPSPQSRRKRRAPRASFAKTLAHALRELSCWALNSAHLGTLTVLIALKLEVIPELLTALICSQGAPLLILAQEPIGLCPKLDARLAELSPKLARLCLMASVSLLCLSEPDQPIAPGSHHLSSFAWSEVNLR